MKKKKISLVLPDLRGGGAERLAIHLARDWIARGLQVDFVLMRAEGELLKLVPSGASVVDLKSKRIRNSVLPLRQYLNSSKPDVVLSGMWPLTSASVIAWFLSGKKGDLYLIDHIQLSVSIVKEIMVFAFVLKAMLRCTYPFATGRMAVSQGVKDDLCRLGGISEQQVKVIYNPAATGISPHRESIEVREQLWGGGFLHHILTVGSFKIQKDHELLIRAFALLPQELNAKLTILGEGELRPKLEELIALLGLEGRVSLPGFSIDPSPWYRSADLFVLSSQWEGLPTVLIEALECGTAIVSTNCPSGPAEILENGHYGKLVPVGDVDALAAAMEDSLSEIHDREALINRAKDFSVEHISEQYLAYFGLDSHV